MSFAEFLASAERDSAPPPGLSAPLRALWLERRGRWDEAHLAVQDAPGPDAAWVHAYIHRREGDDGNADYWYGRASRQPADGELNLEWEEIARELLSRTPSGETR